MTLRISSLALGLLAVLPFSAPAATYDFQDVSDSFHFTSPAKGPGVFPTTGNWTGFIYDGAYANNGVDLTLSGFQAPILPQFIVDAPDPYAGTPAFLLSQSAEVVNGYATFQLTNIPAAPPGFAYDLFLYGTNLAANGSTTFVVTQGGGHADKGIDRTINAPDPGKTTGPNDVFGEGRNYVLYDDLTPVNGQIDGLVSPSFADIVSQIRPTGSADLNGLQLVEVPVPSTARLTIVATPEPASAAILSLSALSLLRRRRRSV